MVITQKIIHTFTVALTLFLSTSSIYANENELCAPFKNTMVDESSIAEMLKAAKGDHLYRIKTSSSKMGFCVQSSVGLVRGDFKKFQGGIALDSGNNQTMVAIDTSSLDTNFLFIEQLLKSDSFLSVDNYPNLIFVSTEFQWLSETKAVMKGQLNMRGVTRDVAFYVDIIEEDGELGDSDTILVKATTTVQRTKFGMHTLSPLVSDKVNLCMSVEAERYKNISDTPPT